MTIQPYRAAALITSAAMRDDDTTVRQLLRAQPAEELAPVAEACVLALAELIREFVPACAIAAAITSAQDMARTEALTERNPR